MEHYVTLFDSLFLPQGLALYRSLQRHCHPFTLWILCVDQKSYAVLNQLQLEDVRLIALDAVETDSLKKVKPGRSIGEYCWTLTPFTPKFVFDADPFVARVTYLDADLWFKRSPKALFSELEQADKQVLITDHAYAPEWDQSANCGRFCVQFMTFVRGGSETVRQWWEDRCIEWCFNRFEDGRFGDQKYLDDWPERFSESVHVLGNKELSLAPWNASRFPYGNAVFWHFHGLRLINTDSKKLRAELGDYPIPRPTMEHIYKPYFDDLRWAVESLSNVGFTALRQANLSFAHRIKSLLRALLNLAWRLRKNQVVEF